MTAPVIDAEIETETEDVNAAEDPTIVIAVATATAIEEQATEEEVRADTAAEAEPRQRKTEQLHQIAAQAIFQVKVLRFAADADDIDNEAITLRAEAEALLQHEAELDALHHQDLQPQYHRQQLQEEGQRHMTFPTLAFYHKELSILQR